jgi:hypothetical protein
MGKITREARSSTRGGGGGDGGESMGEGRGVGGGGGGAHVAFQFLRFNVVSSGTHNNVPAYLAGRKYAELPAAGL